MELDNTNLTLPKEKIYFRIILVFAIIGWIAITVTLVGPVIGLGFAILMWFANGLFAANLKADCVAVDETQLPKLYQTFKDVCQKLGVQPIPELYIAQSGGLLNAFFSSLQGGS